MCVLITSMRLSATIASCLRKMKNLCAYVQSFLDIVLTDCDLHASMLQSDDEDAAVANRNSSHWATAFADENYLVATNNFNFLPVGSGAPGFNNRLPAYSVNRQKQQTMKLTSQSLNPLQTFKRKGILTATSGRSIRDVRRSDSQSGTGSTWGDAVLQHQALLAARTRTVRGSAIPKAAESSQEVRQQEVAVQNNNEGLFPTLQRRTTQKHPAYISKLIQKQGGDTKLTTSQSCRSSSLSDSSMVPCPTTARVLQGVEAGTEATSASAPICSPWMHCS